MYRARRGPARRPRTRRPGTVVHRRMAPPLDGLVTWHLDVPDVERWSAEQPRLYPLHVVLRDPDGAVAEEMTVQVGFRRVEIRGLDLLVNGARVFIRGVNRHDFDQHTGRVISVETMRADLVADEAVRVQRRAHLALPERPGLPRPDRRARAVRHRRGRHRIARLPEHAVRRPPLPVAVGRPRLADGAARQEPRLGHPLVARQRVRLRAQPRGRGRLAAPLRPEPAAPLRGRDPLRLDERPGRQRPDLPDVPADLGDRRSRPVRAPAPPADHVRVQPRDGQQQRDAGRVLGRHRVDARAPGRVHLGVLGPRPGPDAARRPDALGLRRRLRRRSPTTATSCATGWSGRTAGPKPAMWEHKRLAAPVRIGGAAADLAGGPGRDRQPPALPRPRLAPGALLADRRRRRDRRRARSTCRRSGPGERATVDLPGWVGAGRRGRRGVPDRPRHDGRGDGWAPAGFEVCAAAAPGRGRDGRAPSAAARHATRRHRRRSTTMAACVHPLLAAPPTLSLWRAPTDNDRIGGMAARWAQAGRRPPRAPPRRHRARRRGDRRPRASTRPRPASRSRTRRPTRRSPTAAIAVVETVEHPRRPRRPAARRHRPRGRARATRRLRWFGSGPHETYPDRKRGGLVGRWESTVDRPVRPVHPAAGERRPRRRPLARAPRRGRRAASGSTSTSRARSRSRTTAPPTSPPRPTTSTSSPVAETIVHLDAAHRGLGHRELRPGHAPRVPARRRQVPLGAGPSATSPRPDRCRSAWSPDDARAPPPQRPDQLRHAGP